MKFIYLLTIFILIHNYKILRVNNIVNNYFL
nr:MAG TPA: hypothetical protein [Bacteriophage sp.]